MKQDCSKRCHTQTPLFQSANLARASLLYSNHFALLDSATGVRDLDQSLYQTGVYARVTVTRGCSWAKAVTSVDFSKLYLLIMTREILCSEHQEINWWTSSTLVKCVYFELYGSIRKPESPALQLPELQVILLIKCLPIQERWSMQFFWVVPIHDHLIIV